VSCASCHKQELAFSDDVAYSDGVNNEITTRNSMAIINARYNFRFFWDKRAFGLENQVLGPIENPLEMGMDLIDLIPKLEALPYYPALFEAAFDTTEINEDKIARALSQFIRSMVSYRSKYDEGIDIGFSNFTQQELNGKDLFYGGETKCNHCHMTDNFYSPSAFNNGLDSLYTDQGVGELTGNPEDFGKFATVSLRNIGLTGPYMHDGRFETLMEVIEHYDQNIQPHPFLDDRVTTDMEIGGPPIQINLTQTEKEELEAFLHTLTDYELTTDVRFSDPFPE
jgi:cytochrome c peroxidase